MFTTFYKKNPPGPGSVRQTHPAEVQRCPQGANTATAKNFGDTADSAGERREELMVKAEEGSLTIGITLACRALRIARSSYYYYRRRCGLKGDGKSQERRTPRRALSASELERVSVRTIYRILHEHDEVRESRNICRHPHYWKPELLATAPNQVWSWDITKT